jgi:hypothetical protein
VNIADPDQSFPRGQFMGTSTRPLTETERFKRCAACGAMSISWTCHGLGIMRDRCRTRCRIGRSSDPIDPR